MNRGAAGAIVAAAVVLLGDLVDGDEAGAETDAGRAVLRVNKGDPDETAADGIHIADGGAGLLKGQPELLHGGLGDVEIGHAMLGHLHLGVYVCLVLEGMEILHVEAGVQMIRVHAHVQKHTRQAHGVTRHRAEAEATRIRDHTRVDTGGGLHVDLQLVLEGIVEGGDHLAGRGAMLLHPLILSIGLDGDVVVDLAKLAAQSVAGIGDAVAGGGVDDDTQSLGVVFVGAGLVLVTEKAHVVGVVAVIHQDLLLGEGEAQDALQTQGRAHGVAVGALVAEDHDTVVFLDLIQNELHLFMHPSLPPIGR